MCYLGVRTAFVTSFNFILIYFPCGPYEILQPGKKMAVITTARRGKTTAPQPAHWGWNRGTAGLRWAALPVDCCALCSRCSPKCLKASAPLKKTQTVCFYLLRSCPAYCVTDSWPD